MTEPAAVSHLHAEYSKCLKKTNITILFAMQSKSSVEFWPDITHFYVLLPHEKYQGLCTCLSALQNKDGFMYMW